MIMCFDRDLFPKVFVRLTMLMCSMLQKGSADGRYKMKFPSCINLLKTFEISSVTQTLYILDQYLIHRINAILVSYVIYPAEVKSSKMYDRPNIKSNILILYRR